MTVTIQHEVTKDELLAMIAQADFSKPEVRQILTTLFPTRGMNDNARLIGEISDFLYN